MDLIGVGGGLLRFDFGILDEDDNLLYLIEYDGKQHYDKNESFYSETLVEHDTLKNEYCKKNNIHLIRLSGDYNKIKISDLVIK